MKLNTVLYKLAATGKIHSWQIEVIGDKYRTISGTNDGKKIVSEWTVAEAKNVGKTNQTTGHTQAVAEAVSMFKDKVSKGYTDDISSLTSRPFSPMLAQKLEDRSAKLIFPVYSQPKLDGIRCIASSSGLISRNNKPFISVPHIFQEIKNILINLEGKYPEFRLDGELYADKFANNFNEIVSLVRKTKPTAEDLIQSKKSIEYHVYDCYLENTTFIDRYDFLKKHFSNIPGVAIVKTYKVDKRQDIPYYYEKYIEEGYEGQMIRTNGFYETKRSKNLLKDKEFIDEEFKILEIHEGIGNRTGTAGYLVCELKDGRQFKSNIKGSFGYLKSVLDNKRKLIGKQATVKYFNLTPDGIPRFPFAIKIDRKDYE